MPSALESTERLVFLDWLRVIAIGLLLLFHTGMLFVGWGWHIVNVQSVPALELPMDIAHRLRMPLLFLIAGASVHFLLRRRSVGAVLRERATRLVVPLAAGMLLVVPPQMYVEYLVRGQWSGGFYHLWFIAYLFVYSLMLVPVFAWWQKRPRGKLQPGAWVYALALPLGINEALLKPYFPESHNLVNDWWNFNHYALLFVYGFVLCSVPGVWDWLLRVRHRNLVLACGVTASILGGEALGWSFFLDDTVGDALTANAFTWTWQLVFLGYGRRWLRCSNAALRYLREAGYPIYILHQALIVVIAWFVVPRDWPWQVKYLAVFGTTLVLCFAIYEGLIRRWRLTRVLFGLKQ